MHFFILAPYFLFVNTMRDEEEMKRVTIDRLELKDHVRWAQDREVYDPTFIDEAMIIAPHPEFAGLSAIYSSKMEELFDLQKRNQHWAAFAPPDNFHLFSKSFFSYQLFPSWKEGEENAEDQRQNPDESEEEEEPDPSQHLTRLVKTLQNFTSHSPRLFEKDKTLVLNLLDSIQWVNELLGQINGKKLQYQRG